MISTKRAFAFGVIGGLIFGGAIMASTDGHAAEPASVVIKTQDQVASYNDGWTDGLASVGLDQNGRPLARHAATHGHRGPNAEEFQELGEAVYAGGKGCHLEWDGTWVKATKKHRAHWVNAWFEAICNG